MNDLNPARVDEATQATMLAGFNRVWKREKRLQNLNQKWLAEKLNIKQPALSQYLHGKTKLSTKMIIRVCNHLKVAPEEMWPGITRIMPNRASMDVIYTLSDPNTEMDSQIIYTSSRFMSLIYVDKSTQWELLNGDICTAPEGSNLIVGPANEDHGQPALIIRKRDVYSDLDANENLLSYVVHLKDENEFKILNAKQYAALDRELVIKDFRLVAVRYR